jgi:hypothetical protein
VRGTGKGVELSRAWNSGFKGLGSGAYGLEYRT